MSKLASLGVATLSALTGSGAFQLFLEVGNGPTLSFYGALAVSALTGMIFQGFLDLTEFAEHYIEEEQEGDDE